MYPSAETLPGPSQATKSNSLWKNMNIRTMSSNFETHCSTYYKQPFHRKLTIKYKRLISCVETGKLRQKQLQTKFLP